MLTVSSDINGVEIPGDSMALVIFPEVEQEGKSKDKRFGRNQALYIAKILS